MTQPVSFVQFRTDADADAARRAVVPAARRVATRAVEAEIFERTVGCGNYVARRGAPVEHWMGVVDGLLKMSNVSPEGKLATFAGMPAGAWFGESTVLKNECRKYDVIALRDSRIACRPRAPSRGCSTAASPSIAVCSTI